MRKLTLVSLLVVVLLLASVGMAAAVTNGRPDTTHPYVGLVVFDTEQAGGPAPVLNAATGCPDLPTVMSGL
jgi:hypothetical protein